LTLLSAAGLAVGLAIGGALILYLLHQRLVHSVDAASRQTASDVSGSGRRGSAAESDPERRHDSGAGHR